MTKDLFDFIEPTVDQKCDRAGFIQSILDSLIDPNDVERADIDHLLPKVILQRAGEDKFFIKAICKHDPFFSKFIYRIIHAEIEQMQNVGIDGFCCFPYQFFELDAKKYLLCETLITAVDDKDIEQRLSGAVKQITLGLTSAFYARMIIEMKGAGSEGERLRVQERIMQYIHRFPDVYDYDVIPFVSEYISDPKESFVKERSSRDLAKIIIASYLFEKKFSKSGAKREVFVKTLNIKIDSFLGSKKTLGVIAAMSFLGENEKIGKEHALKAVRKIIPKILIKEDTFRLFTKSKSKSVFVYFELEKKDGEISLNERRKLQAMIPKVLVEHIQTFTRKIFMPQNTEEVMKYTVALSKELRAEDDIPQVAVLFDSQTEESLLFTVIVVKPKNYKNTTVFEYFTSFEKKQEIRIKHIRSLGEFKEAVELSYKLKITPFFREDYTVDIYRARAKVVADLQTRFEGVRDYNGGMLQKQESQLAEIHSEVKKRGIKNSVAVDNFFYSLFPQEMRTIVDKHVFTDFFTGFYDLLSSTGKKEPIFRKIGDKLFFHCQIKLKKRKEFFIQEMRNFELLNTPIIYYTIEIEQNFYQGVLFFHPTEKVKESFLEKMSLCFKL